MARRVPVSFSQPQPSFAVNKRLFPLAFCAIGEPNQRKLPSHGHLNEVAPDQTAAGFRCAKQPLGPVTVRGAVYANCD